MRLHTDRVPAGWNQVPDAEGAKKLRNEKFRNEGLPLYVIARPNGDNDIKVIAIYEDGLIRDVSQFAQWLESGFKRAQRS